VLHGRVRAPAASAEIWALWRDTIRRTLLNFDQLSFGELLLLPDDFGGNDLALDGVGNKNGFALFSRDAFSAERDVFDFQINKPHFITNLLQLGVSANDRRDVNENSTCYRGPTEVSCRAKRPLNGGLEVVELDGVDEMLGGAGLQTSLDIAVIAKAADRNPRNIGDRAQLHHQFHSGSIRKRNIANEQIEFVSNGSVHGRADLG